MSEPEALNHLRQNLRSFRSEVAKRQRLEAEASARLNTGIQQADETRNLAQREADTVRARADADANSRYKTDRQAADAALANARNMADDGLKRSEAEIKSRFEAESQSADADLFHAKEAADLELERAKATIAVSFRTAFEREETTRQQILAQAEVELKTSYKSLESPRWILQSSGLGYLLGSSPSSVSDGLTRPDSVSPLLALTESTQVAVSAAGHAIDAVQSLEEWQVAWTRRWNWIALGAIALLIVLVVTIIAESNQLFASNAAATATAQAPVTATARAAATATERARPTSTPTPTPLPDAFTNSATVNLRGGPGVDFPTLGNYPRNIALVVNGKNLGGDWLKVRMPDGKEGWMTADLLQVNVSLSRLSVAETEPSPISGIAASYGPVEGTLNHKEDNFVATNSLGVKLKNFVIAARFYNPFDGSRHNWDYGFGFRSDGGNDQYRLRVSQFGNWTCDLVRSVTAEPGYSFDSCGSGRVPMWYTSATDSNELRLEVRGNTAIFYANGLYVGMFDVSRRTDAGNLFVGTGFNKGSELDGESTKYQNLTVWAIE